MTIDPIWSPDTQQRVFRRLFNAMASPATIWTLADVLQAEPAWKAVLAVLADGMVALSDPHGMLDDRMRQFSQAVVGSPENAAYIVADGRRGPQFEPALGTLESPEQGATILLIATRLGAEGLCVTCTGPGIETRRRLCVQGLDPQWLERRRRWNKCFPLGVDYLIADDERIAALPRTTRVLEGEG